MSVGDAVIDEDHQHLIDLVNKYEAAVEHKSPQALAMAFDGLVRYAQTHFEREEKIMEAVHFPDRRTHADHHKDLLSRMEAFHKELEVHRRFDLKKTTTFLHDWLIDHVLNEDMRLKPYLKGERKDW